MSNPSSWPRDEHGAEIWPDRSEGCLIASPPSVRPRYEPLLVTTLRRHVRRGASQALLDRLAGSPLNFNLLNRAWDIDGRVYDYALALLPDESAPVRDRYAGLGVLGHTLSRSERRIALMQLIVEYRLGGRVFPTTSALARYLGCSERQVDDDIDWLRAEGRIACELSSSVRHTRRRVIRLVAAVPA